MSSQLDAVSETARDVFGPDAIVVWGAQGWCVTVLDRYPPARGVQARRSGGLCVVRWCRSLHELAAAMRAGARRQPMGLEEWP